MSTEEQLKMIRDYKNGIVIQKKTEDDEWVDLEENHIFDFVHTEYRYKEEIPWQDEVDIDKAMKKWHEKLHPEHKITYGEIDAFKAGAEWQRRQDEINQDITDPDPIP